jgi:hypothetical protein
VKKRRRVKARKPTGQTNWGLTPFVLEGIIGRRSYHQSFRVASI